MAAINIAFNVPQASYFDVDKFQQQILEYADRLIANIVSQGTESANSHRVLDYRELSPEIQSLIGICKGAVSEDDINGDIAHEEYLSGKYGEA